jgi:hypothetical protein
MPEAKPLPFVYQFMAGESQSGDNAHPRCNRQLSTAEKHCNVLLHE